jgi:formylglycine-generating enzyme required for sulfatase activity
MALWPQAPGLESLRVRIDLARYYGAFKPGQDFVEILADGGIGPEMIVVPRGVFDMGSADDAPSAQQNEKPRRKVRFLRGFAISRSEITVSDFRRFVDATGYKTLATRLGRSTVYDERGGNLIEHDGVDWRRDHAGAKAIDNQPVLHVAFEDAMAYSDWLSEQTGQRYRLPSEAEWEYVMRAGSHGAYPWGEGRPGRLVGNLAGDGDRSPRLRRRWGNALADYRDGFWGPAPAASFSAERFSTRDMIGNVAEWTLDCWHDSYRRAPDDGSAWINPGCEQRVVRGASWSSAPGNARSAYRAAAKTDTRNARLGMRLVREI